MRRNLNSHIKIDYQPQPALPPTYYLAPNAPFCLARQAARAAFFIRTFLLPSSTTTWHHILPYNICRVTNIIKTRPILIGFSRCEDRPDRPERTSDRTRPGDIQDRPIKDRPGLRVQMKQYRPTDEPDRCPGYRSVRVLDRPIAITDPNYNVPDSSCSYRRS